MRDRRGSTHISSTCLHVQLRDPASVVGSRQTPITSSTPPHRIGDSAIVQQWILGNRVRYTRASAHVSLYHVLLDMSETGTPLHVRTAEKCFHFIAYRI